MKLRNYRPGDLLQILTLFRETVHTINRQDYTQEQCDAWAPACLDEAVWQESLEKSISLIVEQADQLIGFATMSPDGYLDKLYVHKDYQGKGIASRLLDALEEEARSLGVKELTTQASISALPFFERKGFVIIKKQQQERRGQSLINYLMQKKL